MLIRRSLLPALIALLVTALTAAPALAHTSLESSSPAEGASLSSAPTTIALTFGEPVKLPADPIRITGPSGAAWTVGKATATDATVTAPVSTSGPAGSYSVAWQVISDDGDTIKGTVKFTMQNAAGPTTTAAAATSAAQPTTAAAAQAPSPGSSGGIPGWIWVLGGVVVAALVAGALVARFRRP